MKKSAVISICEKYRYELRRIWDKNLPLVLFVLLNPSTANEIEEDNTTRRCESFSRKLGYGGYIIANLFAYRDTTQNFLITEKDPVGPENDVYLIKLQSEVSLVICGWGNKGITNGRNKEVMKLLKDPHYLQLNKTGEPRHPLYIDGNAKPCPFFSYK